MDLDAGNRRESDTAEDSFVVQNVLKYKASMIKKDPNSEAPQPILGMFVRASSDKEQVDSNEKLVTFFLHDGILLSWTQTNEHKNAMKSKLMDLKKAQREHDWEKYEKLSQKFDMEIHYDPGRKKDFERHFRSMSTVSDQFNIANSDCFIFMQNEYVGNEIFSQKIVKCFIDFADFTLETIFTEFYSNERIINLKVDASQQRVLIFTKVVKLAEDQGNQITILDIASNNIVYETLIKNRTLIGRLKSGNYSVSEGHMYFSNNVIKIRYDLIQRPNSSQYSEKQVFDFYEDIFKLKKNEIIMANCPLVSDVMNKFVYIIRNQKLYTPPQIIVLPFLHENRIVLHRNKPSTEYFYTSTQRTVRLDQASNVNPFSIATKKNSYIMQSIVAMNLTESKYYVFSLRGLLRNRVEFKKEIQRYGKLKAVSPNGRNFVLMKDKQQYENQKIKIAIFHLTDFEFTFVKEIDIFEDISTYITKLAGSKVSDVNKRRVRQEQGQKLQELILKSRAPNRWIFNPNTTKYLFSITDNLDVMIKFKYQANEVEDKRRRSTRRSNHVK